MKKALNAWSVPSDVTFEEMFRDVSAAGFEGIELNVDAENKSAHSLTMSSTKEMLEEIRGLSEKYSLPIASVSSSLYANSLGSADSLVREGGKNVLRKQLEYAKTLGADGILVVPGGNFDEVTLKEAWENSLTALGELKSEIEDAKINVGLENVWNAFFTSPFDMKNYIDELDCKYIGAYFDVGNVVAFSNPEHWIDILGERIVKIHVKDYARAGGVNRGGSFVNLMQGSVKWQAVTKVLKSAGYDGYLTAELGIIEESPIYLYEITSRALDIIIGK